MIFVVDIFNIQTEAEKSDSTSRIVPQENKGQQNQASQCSC